MAVDGLSRFPVLATFVHKAMGQARTMWGDPEAHESFQAAMEAAEASGLYARRDALMAYMRKV